MASCSIPAHPIVDQLHLEPPLPADFKGRKAGILDQPVDRALGDDEVVRHLLHRDQLAFLFFLLRHEHVFPPRCSGPFVLFSGMLSAELKTQQDRCHEKL